MSGPTLSRLGKVLTLQWTAFNHAELECADAKSALLQGDGHEMQDTESVYAKALDEIACAMRILSGSVVRLSKAVYGLGNAPQSWWLSVDPFLTSMERTENADGSDSLVFLRGRSRNHVRVRWRCHHHWHSWTEICTAQEFSS